MNKFYSALAVLFLCISSCTMNPAKINNSYKKYFDSAHVEGTFAMLNNQIGSLTVYNMSLDTQRFSPGTSFKILNTLIGVQAGVIANENTSLSDSADTTKMTLKEAFSKSYTPFFQAVARKVGIDTMKSWIDRISYGNKITSAPVDSLWLTNQLKISPDEQLGLLSKLYFNQLPFQKYAQQVVQDQLLQEDNTLYKYSFTIGAGVDESQKPFAWNLGWIEENRHVYFFVTFLKGNVAGQDVHAAVDHITRAILKESGFFKGEK